MFYVEKIKFDTKRIVIIISKPAIAIRPFHISACGVNPLFQELISLELAGLVDSLDSLRCFNDITEKLKNLKIFIKKEDYNHKANLIYFMIVILLSNQYF